MCLMNACIFGRLWANINTRVELPRTLFLNQVDVNYYFSILLDSCNWNNIFPTGKVQQGYTRTMVLRRGNFKHCTNHSSPHQPSAHCLNLLRQACNDGCQVEELLKSIYYHVSQQQEKHVKTNNDLNTCCTFAIIGSGMANFCSATG